VSFSPSRRVWLLVGLVLAGILLPWAVWGARFEEALSPVRLAALLGSEPRAAAAAGVGLICADILLPVPATPVMSALGLVLGPWWGGLVSATGSFLAGCLAYGLARFLGRAPAAWVAGEGMAGLEERFAAQGGWMVALSRWTPVLPEAVAALAGVARMPFGRFAAALACGSLPLGFAFAWVGHLGHESPALALALSALLPALLWLTAGRAGLGTCRSGRSRS
jgi:uncharacterized membrane protein YdjX (TVP38/TMEM64 family)